MNARGFLLVSILASGCGRDVGVGGAATTDAAFADAASVSTCPHVHVEARCKDQFCLVPAGCFVMGSPPTEPGRGRNTEDQTEVTYTHSFVMSDHEVTQGEWTGMGFENLAGTEPNADVGTDCREASCPAAMLNWYQAIEYTHRLSEREGLPHCFELQGAPECTGTPGQSDRRCTEAKPLFEPYTTCPGYRLPTAGESEYATRAGTSTAFPSGDFSVATEECVDVPGLSEIAWYCINYGGATHPVRTRKPNAWGLYDLTGNAGEFVAENGGFYGYSDEPGSGKRVRVVDPKLNKGSKDPLSRIIRSGVYYASAMYQRSAWRLAATASARGPGAGFRVVRTLSPEQAKAW